MATLTHFQYSVTVQVAKCESLVHGETIFRVSVPHPTHSGLLHCNHTHKLPQHENDTHATCWSELLCQFKKCQYLQVSAMSSSRFTLLSASCFQSSQAHMRVRFLSHFSRDRSLGQGRTAYYTRSHNSRREACMRMRLCLMNLDLSHF